MEIDVHDDVMRRFDVADPERAHCIHGVMSEFGSGLADEVEKQS